MEHLGRVSGTKAGVISVHLYEWFLFLPAGYRGGVYLTSAFIKGASLKRGDGQKV